MENKKESNFYMKSNFENPSWKTDPEDEWGLVGGLGVQRSLEVALNPFVVQRKSIKEYAKSVDEDYDSIIHISFIPKSSEKEAWEAFDERMQDYY